MDQIIHPSTPDKSIFYYIQASPTSVHHITFAAGPFEMHVIHQEDKKVMLGFCLPGDQDDMQNSTAFMSKAMSFYSKEFGVYPYSDYKMVFVSDPRVQHSIGATMSIFNAEILHGTDQIDQVYDTRHTLGLAFAQQWIGVNIIPRTLADTWVTSGLAIFMYALFLRHLQGNNEYRFRLKRAIDKCARMDQGDKAPICMPGATEIDTDFINLKAPLVMHILDRHLAKAGTSLGLTRVIPKIFLTALSDELAGNVISTNLFFKFCRKVSGLDLSPFADQWVYGSGCPKMRITTNFIRKKFLVELGVEQTQPATKGKKRPTAFFEVRILHRERESTKVLMHSGESDSPDSRGRWSSFRTSGRYQDTFQIVQSTFQHKVQTYKTIRTYCRAVRSPPRSNGGRR
jgi:transcription initiation factor TFIID subunit 2